MPVLKKFLKQAQGKKILLLAHKAADVDAFASAAALYLAFPKLKLEIGAPGYLNLQAKALADNFSIPHLLNPVVSGFQALVLLDFNNLEMIGSEASAFQEFKGPCFLIDHHSESSGSIAKKAFSILDSKAVSTTEIIFKIFKREKIQITPKIAQLLAAGIIADSANFITASSETFKSLSELLQIAGKEFAQITRLYSLPPDVSQRIASLKAAKRVQLFKAGNVLVATSEVSCFENAAADSLIQLGADVAFVGFRNEKNQVRLSARASEDFVQKTGFDLALDVLSRLEGKFQGSSGGHPGAAGFNGIAESLEPLLQECVLLCEEFLKSRKISERVKKLKDD
ncbi:MAG: phosphoesterase RecJ protein [archaeon GW2011_AR21]|nr:MAG: phosphoesterase RecJ protein [archaeon GW2011_AR21]